MPDSKGSELYCPGPITKEPKLYDIFEMIFVWLVLFLRVMVLILCSWRETRWFLSIFVFPWSQKQLKKLFLLLKIWTCFIDIFWTTGIKSNTYSCLKFKKLKLIKTNQKSHLTFLRKPNTIRQMVVWDMTIKKCQMKIKKQS